MGVLLLKDAHYFRARHRTGYRDNSSVLCAPFRPKEVRVRLGGGRAHSAEVTPASRRGPRSEKREGFEMPHDIRDMRKKVVRNRRAQGGNLMTLNPRVASLVRGLPATYPSIPARRTCRLQRPLPRLPASTAHASTGCMFCGLPVGAARRRISTSCEGTSAEPTLKPRRQVVFTSTSRAR